MRIFKLYIVLLFVILNTNNLFSQENENLKEIEILFDKLYFANEDAVKLEVNSMVKTKLRNYIETKKDYIDDFKNIKNLSTLVSDDKDIFIFTWAINLEKDGFKYFGFVKYYNNNRGIYEILELIDNEEINTEQLQSKFFADNWYGAVYYKIIAKKYKKKRTYLLLGWDANDDFTNKKIIDILYVDKDEEQPIFGKNIIDYNGKNITRLIFEYTERVAMTLKYDEKLKMVVWDHLSPSKQEFKGIYKYYGPDFSFDALQFEKGIWKYIPDIELNK